VGETPRRNIRVSDELWVLAEKRATDAGTTLSELIRGWLEEYGSGRMPTAPDPRATRAMQALRGLAEQLEPKKGRQMTTTEQKTWTVTDNARMFDAVIEKLAVEKSWFTKDEFDALAAEFGRTFNSVSQKTWAVATALDILPEHMRPAEGISKLDREMVALYHKHDLRLR
jgi:hypothetical protein